MRLAISLVLAASSAGMLFGARAQMQVNGLTPPVAVTTPGAAVLITGEGFTPASRVYFSGFAVREVRFLDARRLEVITPYLPPGEHSLSVRTGPDTVEAKVKFVSVPTAVDRRIDTALADAGRGQPGTALSALKDIAEHYPDFQVRAYARYRMANVYFSQSDWLRWAGESAGIFLDSSKSGEAVQTYWPYRLAYAQSHYLLVQNGPPTAHEKSVDTWLYDEAVRRDVTGSPELRFWRGVVNARTGRTEAALQDSEYCLRADPENPKYLALGALVAASGSDDANARQLAQSARAKMEATAPDRDALTILGEAAFIADDPREAEHDWFEAGKGAESRAGLSLLAAKKHLWRGETRTATMLLDEAASLGPGTSEGRESRHLLQGLTPPEVK